MKVLKNESTGGWVILAPERAKRPHQAGKSSFTCPFDDGAEGETPPEVMRLGRGEPDGPGWEVRVVPNLFPITDRHEVIIHSPDHARDIPELECDHVQKIFEVFRERYLALQDGGRPLIFNNAGVEAGASLPHPHSQLTVIPAELPIRSPRVGDWKEPAHATDHFEIFSPADSIWPYETWIRPRRRGELFGEVGDEPLAQLAALTQRVLQILRGESPALPYNFYVYPDRDWYLRIVGRSKRLAGFELGSGGDVNAMDPAEVATLLKRGFEVS